LDLIHDVGFLRKDRVTEFLRPLQIAAHQV
jgi:hypothetical protein